MWITDYTLVAENKRFDEEAGLLLRFDEQRYFDQEQERDHMYLMKIKERYKRTA